MIENRPQHLIDDPNYRTLPPLPIGVDFTSLPTLLGRSLDELGGIQPITRQMSEAAAGPLYDKPSDGEVALHRQNGTSFQMISVIVSVFYTECREQIHIVRPFAISLLPASKMGQVDVRSIDAIAQLDVDAWLKSEPCYKGFDPFKGTYGLYGTLGTLLDKEPKPGFIDEIGLVVRQYFLATTHDDGEVLISPAGLSHPGAEKRYQRHRKRLFFSPFHKVETRRVWGAEIADRIVSDPGAGPAQALSSNTDADAR